jgi:hypothetical protein
VAVAKSVQFACRLRATEFFFNIEIQTTEPLVPGPSCPEVEISIAKLKKYKSPGIYQIPTEQIQAGVETLVSVIHKLSGRLA